MAKIIKILKTLRNHWKKSIVAFVALNYGASYAKDRYRIEQMMQAYCEEAKQYGEMPLPINGKAKHVTVILNPVAKNGKGKALYEKYAAPLLHLAGMKVSIFQTEQEGQAKDLMEIMDSTDAVVVAGGNGTLHEMAISCNVKESMLVLSQTDDGSNADVHNTNTVTGLLRRDDSEIATQRFPIGIIPIGKTNSIAKSLFPHSNDAQLLAESAMAVIKEIKKPLDVMKVEGNKGKPVYALSNLELGVFRDTDSNISKYWYFGPLKTKVAYFLRSLRQWPSNQEFELSYIYPCDGCSKCYELPQKELVPNRRWWQSFVPRTTQISSVSAKQVKDYNNITNDECGLWHTEHIPASNISIETENLENTELCHDKEKSALNIIVHSPNLTRWQFIKEGNAGHKDTADNEPVLKKITKIRELKLLPKETEGKEQWCNIDNDNYELQPVHIRLLPKKVYIYCKESPLKQ